MPFVCRDVFIYEMLHDVFFLLYHAAYIILKPQLKYGLYHSNISDARKTANWALLILLRLFYLLSPFKKGKLQS